MTPGFLIQGAPDLHIEGRPGGEVVLKQSPSCVDEQLIIIAPVSVNEFIRCVRAAHKAAKQQQAEGGQTGRG